MPACHRSQISNTLISSYLARNKPAALHAHQIFAG
jgi:hypothetical protein